ncbi:hypothetical protein HMPREF9554_02598 [Treponema phagedenis F0421]|nr:hypothetical protein HMPREF9554_02598 [Treponema phagedenis F0421]
MLHLLLYCSGMSAGGLRDLAFLWLTATDVRFTISINVSDILKNM